jgi:hypothetical protein
VLRENGCIQSRGSTTLLRTGWNLPLFFFFSNNKLWCVRRPNMSASPIARQATQCQTIPSRRVVINDASQLPADYSTTPGGTVYSTTPGGRLTLTIAVCVVTHLAGAVRPAH